MNVAWLWALKLRYRGGLYSGRFSRLQRLPDPQGWRSWSGAGFGIGMMGGMRGVVRAALGFVHVRMVRGRVGVVGMSRDGSE